MGVLVRKQKGLIFTKIGRLSVVVFVVTLAFALVDTIWAVYMDSFINSIVLVGFLSAILTFVSFLSDFIFIPFIEKTNKSKIYSYSLLLLAVSYILFAINTKFYSFIILAFITTILLTLKTTSLGIIVRDESSKRLLSRNEGVMYTFMNASYLIGPLIAGFISEKYNVSLVFLLSGIFILTALFLFKTSNIKDVDIKKKIDYSFTKNFLDFFKNKDRVLAYILSGGVNFWWSLIYLFMPLYIIRSGLGSEWVGYFLFAAVIPLVFFTYYFSKLAGKIGFKKIFKIGFLIPSFFALLCFFTSNIYLILLFLIFASIGLAMIESTTEAYFFDILKGKERLRFYGPYNTTIEINHFIARILSATLLVFMPFKFIFLLFSFFMFLFFIVSFKVRDIVEAKKRLN